MTKRRIITIAEQPAIDQILKLRVNELNLSIRPINCLHSVDVPHVGELVQQTEEDL